jgi:phospholipid/cholesterol/gamma-HCH transport system permease protein
MGIAGGAWGSLARAGRLALGVVAELGAAGLLLGSAASALMRPRGDAPPLAGVIGRQLVWIFGAGLPLVGLVHVGMGSFLAMQAYFGATFAEGSGPVVGVGLIRNGAPLLTGMILAGLFASRTVTELRLRSRVGVDDDPRGVVDRDVAQGRAADVRLPVPSGRIAAARLIAAGVSGPILALWGAAVGTLVGWQVAQTILGVSTSTFFVRLVEMLWIKDVVGLVLKGVVYGVVAALFACVEGLRGVEWSAPSPAALDAAHRASLRAVCLAALAILFCNSCWFVVVYLGRAPFSPSFD